MDVFWQHVFWLLLLWLLMVGAHLGAHLLGQGVAHILGQVATPARVHAFRFWILNASD